MITKIVLNLMKQDDEALKAYKRYIASKEFKLLRIKVFERDNYRCLTCGRTLEEIEQYNRDKGKHLSLLCHHCSYLHLGLSNEMEENDCITLCNICHKAVHSAKSNMRRFLDKSSILKNIDK